MENENSQLYTAFEGFKQIAHGPLDEVVLKVRKRSQADHSEAILVFSDATGKQMDFDLSGSERDVLKRLENYVTEEPILATGPGRPKLGVVSREISLLPWHWEWLSLQSGGASGTLRRLVDEARKRSSGRDEKKRFQESTYKFLAAIAGNLPEYEEALRALFNRDVKKHALGLAAGVFE